MADKPKLKCSSKSLGPKGVAFDLDGNIPDFGRFDLALKYHLESEEMASAVLNAAEEAEKTFDAMEVAIEDASIEEFITAVDATLRQLLTAIKEKANG